MLRSLCDNCDDPLACVDAGRCFIKHIKATRGHNLSEEVSDLNVAWSGLHMDESQIRVAYSDNNWLDSKGFDVVN